MRAALLPGVVRGRLRSAARPEWMLIWAGLAALYLPTLHRLATEVWNKSAQVHGPVILALALWLMYRKWPELAAARSGDRPSRAGWCLLVPALLLYVLGRSQQILIFELGSLIPVAAAILLLMHGPRALRTQWFPLFFMLFMIPLPEALITMLTMPMKTAVSFVTEHILSFLGYPVGRQGVILQVGAYQLLVADACAGLQTVLTLEAMGLFYLNTTRHAAALRNALLALLIVPISFTANIIRVLALTLVTYHLGDAAGQGFLHQFAGLVLFLSALMLILGVDGALQMMVARRGAGAGKALHA
jgi:exosortase B